MAHQLYVLQCLLFSLLHERRHTPVDPTDQVTMRISYFLHLNTQTRTPVRLLSDNFVLVDKLVVLARPFRLNLKIS